MGVAALVAALVAGIPEARAATPDTAGVFDPATGRWHLLDGEGRTATFTYGDPGDVPFAGDWDCDGIDSPGLYRRSDGFVYLRNSATTGIADVAYFFGNPGDVPLAGDFDGDGCDTVSLYRPAEARVYVVNRLGRGHAGLGAADIAYSFGDRGDVPFAGDFDGDGIDTVGVHRPETGVAYLNNRHGGGAADAAFRFGDPDDRFLAGDWTGDGVDTAAVFRPSDRRVYLRNRNSSGAADHSVLIGRRHMVPVAGSFDLGDRARPVDWRSLTVAVTGDLLIHPGVSGAARISARAYDFRPLFAAVQPMIAAADLALCHLEVPLSPDNTGLHGYPRFNAPGEVAAAVAWAGYDGCSTASNHSIDMGAAGVAATLDLLDAAGLGHAGTARSAAEAHAITTYEVLDGATVAHLSYTWWLNGLRLPVDAPWLASLLDPGDVLADAARARAGGADVVAVSIHWGNEYQVWPNPQQFAVAGTLAASPDVDLIIGHHAHVVQPIGLVHGKYVVYGLGNFLSGQVAAPRRDGVIVFLELVPDAGRWRVDEVRYQPTMVASGYRIVPADAASAQRTASALGLLGAPGLYAL